MINNIAINGEAINGGGIYNSLAWLAITSNICIPKEDRTSLVVAENRTVIVPPKVGSLATTDEQVILLQIPNEYRTNALPSDYTDMLVVAENRNMLIDRRITTCH